MRAENHIRAFLIYEQLVWSPEQSGVVEQMIVFEHQSRAFLIFEHQSKCCSRTRVQDAVSDAAPLQSLQRYCASATAVTVNYCATAPVCHCATAVPEIKFKTLHCPLLYYLPDYPRSNNQVNSIVMGSWNLKDNLVSAGSY